MKRRTLLSWSSGKDSAWALYKLQQDPEIDLVGIFSTVNKKFNRIAMHGVKVELLYLQAECIGLPLQLIEIPYPCSNEEYEEKMARFVEKSKQNKIDCFAFGDLFLEDIRKYREEKLKGTGIAPIFPIWGIPTDKLSEEMINKGLKAVITCVDPKQISETFIGRSYDKSFLNNIPKDIDPCGENGEFHSFAYGGPMFEKDMKISVGKIVRRDGFVFVDVSAKGN
ncbi:MAG: adenine nucleotide alpha hydrolase [Candidatus Schekmanbacteria bacterium]|nr:MAG: adenine nucleotide alpha hydrolase [Candidatus Schekmanbacteria bacterium]